MPSARFYCSSWSRKRSKDLVLQATHLKRSSCGGMVRCGRSGGAESLCCREVACPTAQTGCGTEPQDATDVLLGRKATDVLLGQKATDVLLGQKVTAVDISGIQQHLRKDSRARVTCSRQIKSSVQQSK